jgi:hypothetical protein
MGFWRLAVLALMVGACTCGEKPGQTDAGDGDTIEDKDIPPIPCWGPPEKCDGTVLPDGGDPRPSMVFQATLTEAALVPPPETHTFSGSAVLTLNGSQTALTAVINHDVPASRIVVRSGAPGESGVLPLGEIDTIKHEPMPVTADMVRQLYRGELFLDVITSGGSVLRGQLLRPDEVLYVARLTGGEATPPHDSKEFVTVYLVHNKATDEYRYWTPAGQLSTPPESLTLEMIGGSKFEDLDPALDGRETSSTDPLSGFGTGAFTADTKPSAPLAAGRLIVKATLPGDPKLHLAGTLLQPGAQLYTATLDGNQGPEKVTTTHNGSVRILVDYLRAKVTYSFSTNATPLEVSLRWLGRDPSSTLPLFQFPVAASGSSVVGVGTSEGKISPAALAAIEKGAAYVSVRSTEKNPDNSEKFPKGELAGILGRAGEWIYTANLSTALNPSEPGDAGSGTAWLYLSSEKSKARYYIFANGLPASWAVFDSAMPYTAAGADQLDTGPFTVIESGASESVGAVDLPPANAWGDAAALGRMRLSVGTNQGLTNPEHKRSSIAGHFLKPGESLYISIPRGLGVAPVQYQTTSPGYAMAIVDPTDTDVHVVVDPNRTAHVVRVCTGVPGVKSDLTNCRSLDAPSATSRLWTRTIGFDAAGFAEGNWYVESLIGDASAPETLTAELRGPFVKPGESVFYANLNGFSVVPQPPSTPGTSMATGQVVFIANALRSEIRYQGTFSLTPTGPAQLIRFEASSTQSMPAPAYRSTIQNVTTSSVAGTLVGLGSSFVKAMQDGKQSVALMTGDTAYPNGLIRGEIREK